MFRVVHASASSPMGARNTYSSARLTANIVVAVSIDFNIGLVCNLPDLESMRNQSFYTLHVGI